MHWHVQFKFILFYLEMFYIQYLPIGKTEATKMWYSNFHVENPGDFPFHKWFYNPKMSYHRKYYPFHSVWPAKQKQMYKSERKHKIKLLLMKYTYIVVPLGKNHLTFRISNNGQLHWNARTFNIEHWKSNWKFKLNSSE